MGGFDFGIYIYVWTWVLLIGGMVDLGLGSASQRLIPEYTEHRQLALLRGYLRGSRFLATAIACAIALAGAAAVTLLKPYLGPETTVPLYLSCAALPMFGLGQVLSGIARSYDWVNLGLAPTYVLRQIALLALMGLAYALGLPTDATTATLLGVAALWSVTIGQLVVLDRRLARTVAKGPQAYAVRSWLADLGADLRGRGLLPAAHLFRRDRAQAVPPAGRGRDLLCRRQDPGAGRLHLLLGGADDRPQIRRLSRQRRPQGAHRFSQAFDPADILAVARFDLILLALGKPMLRLFGNDFVSGYYLMFIIAVGLLARAAVGPAERLLNMLGERRSCALVYAGSFFIDLVLCLALIPWLGIAGAAIASAVALIFESASLFFVAKYRLGLHCLIFGQWER